jgi:hypothetical protein
MNNSTVVLVRIWFRVLKEIKCFDITEPCSINAKNYIQIMISSCLRRIVERKRAILEEKG